MTAAFSSGSYSSRHTARSSLGSGLDAASGLWRSWTSAAAPGSSPPRSGRPRRGPRSGGSTSSPQCWPRAKRPGDRTRNTSSRSRGTASAFPSKPAHFDVVTCANSFHHYPHQDCAVAEMYRVLKPGGRLFLVDGCRDGLWGWFIYDVCVAGVEGDVLHASAHRIRSLFGRAGFVETHQKIYSGLAPFLLTEGVSRSRAKPRLRSSAESTGASGTGVGLR